MRDDATEYLWVFGFALPVEFRARRDGELYESSAAVFIRAAEPQQAAAWGRQIAETFYSVLHERYGDGPRSWARDQFASWIETNLSDFGDTSTVPHVGLGELPDIEEWLAYFNQVQERRPTE